MTSPADRQHPHWRTDIEIGPLTPASEFIEEEDHDPITEACPRCGIRLQSIPADIIHPDDRGEYRDDELVWFEFETLDMRHHDDVRCYRQRKVRDANTELVARWLVSKGDDVRVGWHDLPDSAEKTAAIRQVKVEQAVAREYLYASLPSPEHPERPAGFTEGVRWAMHMLAQAHRGENGWRREWDVDYLAQLDDERQGE